MQQNTTISRRAVLASAALAGIPFLAKAAPAQAEDVPEGTVAQFPLTSERNLIQPQSASVLPIAIRGRFEQTANLTEWQDYTGKVHTAVSPEAGRVIRPDTGDGHGPFSWEVGSNFFNGVRDPVSYFGYNVKNLGRPIVAGEPYAAWIIEADYDDGVKRTMEQYVEVRSADGNVNLRPLFFQVKRDATTPEEMLTGAEIMGNPLLFMTPSNTGGFPQQRAVPMARLAPNRFTMEAVNQSSDNVISVRAPTTGNARLQLGRNGLDNVITINPGTNTRGDFKVNNALPLQLYSNPKGVPAAGGGSITVGGVFDNSAVGLFAVNTNSASVKGLVARGRSGQAASLLEVQDSAAAVLGGFDKNGYFFTSKKTAPADADLANGQLMIWFDDKPSQSKLMIKAKSSNGAIRTGSIALS